ncbi:MAG TPA: hypothetical protein VGK73_34595 [Polyangiaceae bacterium]
MHTLSDLHGTQWTGTQELWLDPLGNRATECACTISVEPGVVRYTWSHEGKAHTGSITLRNDGADFIDTWHQPEPMRCRSIPGAWGLFQVEGEYGLQLNWRWRTGLSLREPTNELILQMTNVAPWGEEVRAVRMTCKRA